MQATGIEVRTGGHAAYYRPSEDYIQMPDAGLFTGSDTSSATEAMYSTLLHEATHAFEFNLTGPGGQLTVFSLEWFLAVVTR